MKAIFIFVILMLTCPKNFFGQEIEKRSVAISTSSLSNDNVLIEIIKDYFRSNPYDKFFSKFLDHLLNDPTLTNKTILKRTDTSFFFFKGEYKDHSPFSFRSDRTEIRLAETEVELSDSLFTKDTLLFYQLLGYSYGGKTGMETVKKEFAKFNRRYGKDFFSSEVSDLKKENEFIGTIKNYFVFVSPFSPLTVAWAKLDDYQNVFTITIRMKIKENIAGLPIPPDSH